MKKLETGPKQDVKTDQKLGTGPKKDAKRDRFQTKAVLLALICLCASPVTCIPCIVDLAPYSFFLYSSTWSAYDFPGRLILCS